MNKKKLNKKKGFTLIELIVVIAILGILAAVAIPRFAGIQDRAKAKSDIANAKMIGNAAETAIVEGKIASTGTITAADVKTALITTDKYIINWPSPKYKGASTEFLCTVTDGVVGVSVTYGETATSLYPAPPTTGDWAQ